MTMRATLSLARSRRRPRTGGAAGIVRILVGLLAPGLVKLRLNLSVEPDKELGYDSWLHWVASAGPHTMKEKLAGLRRKEKRGRQALRIWPKGRFWL
jgi:hypothetical protein